MNLFATNNIVTIIRIVLWREENYYNKLVGVRVGGRVGGSKGEKERVEY